MITAVLAFLGLSLFAYCLTGGADFGVGIVETFSRREEQPRIRELGERAIAPVWEANHIWIIVALVITFVAFPAVHVHMTTFLHVPLLVMLAGIIVRGTGFTFRYYDVGGTPAEERLWAWLFRGGSLLVPLAFGCVAASMSRGRLPVEPTTVWASYFAPWLGAFPFAVGLFTLVLFGWLALVFLVGEAAQAERRQLAARARRWTILAVVTGGLVTGSAWWESVPWLARAPHPAALVAVGVATVGVVALWRTLDGESTWWPRILAGVVLAAILGGYWGAALPVALELAGGEQITWYGAAAPAATIQGILIALAVGSCLILPGLVWLYRLFKLGPVAERAPEPVT